jgi:NAD(P)-dependent dehydrogenase (short-subunit alcohol dehydrogenase family)
VTPASVSDPTSTTVGRRYGHSAEQLAGMPTVYRSDLLRDRAFVISGGGSGMGRATAFLMSRLGASVLICGRDEAKLKNVADDIERLVGKRPLARALNIREPERVASVMTEAFDTLGRVDGLVNSAGGQFPQHALEIKPKGWNAVVDTNLNGTWWMMQAAAREWQRRGRPGSIVNIVASFTRGLPHMAHTAAARAGVTYLSKTVAIEWAPLEIRVNCIAPGQIETEGLNQYDDAFKARLGRGSPMRRLGDAWDIAEAIVYLSGATGKFVTGELLHVDGGMQLWGNSFPLGIPEHLAGG